VILIEKLSNKGFKLGFDIENNLVARECTNCRDYKSIMEFSKHSSLQYGYSPSCKVCNSNTAKQFSEKNKEKIILR